MNKKKTTNFEDKIIEDFKKNPKLLKQFKISIAKDGTLIVDVKEDALKQILIKNIVTKKFGNEYSKNKKTKLKNKEKNTRML